VQVTTGALGAVDAALAEHGYEIEAPVDILVAPAVAPPARSGIDIDVTHTLDDAWAETYAAFHDGNDRVAAYGRMLSTIGPRAFAVTAAIDNEDAGMGFGVVERGWCGIYGMATLAGHRRRGVATAVLHALAREASDLGAANLYLQLERDNDGARALYERAGFKYEYGYHYRTQMS
jgi:GNAT superfamily N-acetyltransferase